MKRHLIFTIIVGTIAATGGKVMADQLNPQPDIPLNPQPDIPRKPNSQLTKSIIIEGECPPEQPLLDGQLEISKVEPLKLEPSQQLPSDRLINRTLRF